MTPSCIELRVGPGRWHLDERDRPIAEALADAYRVTPSGPTGPADLVIHSGPADGDHVFDGGTVRIGLHNSTPPRISIALPDVGPIDHRVAYRMWLYLNRALLNLGHVLVHGAAVTVEGRTSLLCGPSGAGKTTLTAALGLSGALVHGEDWLIAHVTPEGVRISGVSSRMRVTDETRDLLLGGRIDGAERTEDEKRKLSFDAATIFDADPHSLHRPDRLYLMSASGDTRISPATRRDGLQQLADQSKWCTQLDDAASFQLYLSRLSALVEGVDVWHLTRDPDHDTTEHLVAAVRDG